VALHDLLEIAPPDRQAPLRRQLDLLTAAIADGSGADGARERLAGDAQGIGAGP
jgi:hypothetical protein